MRKLLALTLLLAGTLPAQYENIRISVTDHLHRYVTGLERANFTVLENGMPLAITSFSAVKDSLAIAVVAAAEVGALEIPGPRHGDEVSVYASVSEALGRLAESKLPRKVLVLAAPVEAANVPADVYVVKSDPEIVSKVAIELRCQYVLQYQPSTPGAKVEVILNQPQGLPVLKVSRSI